MKPIRRHPKVNICGTISRMHVLWQIFLGNFLRRATMADRICDFLQTQKNLVKYLRDNYEEEPYVLVMLLEKDLRVFIYNTKGQTHSNLRPYWMSLDNRTVGCYLTSHGYIHHWNRCAPNNAGKTWDAILFYDLPKGGYDYFVG